MGIFLREKEKNKHIRERKLLALLLSLVLIFTSNTAVFAGSPPITYDW